MLLKMLPFQTSTGEPVFAHHPTKEDLEAVKSEKLCGDLVRIVLVAAVESNDFNS